MTVYKNPTCGCCQLWIRHMELAGFEVEAVDRSLSLVERGQYGLTRQTASCHTALIGEARLRGAHPTDCDCAVPGRSTRRRRARGAGNASRVTGDGVARRVRSPVRRAPAGREGRLRGVHDDQVAGRRVPLGVVRDRARLQCVRGTWRGRYSRLTEAGPPACRPGGRAEARTGRRRGRPTPVQ